MNVSIKLRLNLCGVIILLTEIMTLFPELLETADEYLDNDFKILCEEVVKEQITLKQVANVYPRVYKMDNVEVNE